MSRQLANVVKVIEHFRAAHQHATVNAISAFLHVATSEGISIGEVQKHLGLEGSTATRAVALLTTMQKGDKPGLNLVKQEYDRKDRRVKRLYLTASGHKLWQQIETTLAA